MSGVERHKGCALTDCGCCNQRIQQPQTVRQMEVTEIRMGALTVRFAGPDDRQRCQQVLYFPYAPRVGGTLIEFHCDETGHAWQLIERGKPPDGRMMASLDVNKDVGIEKAYGGKRQRCRLLAGRRSARA